MLDFIKEEKNCTACGACVNICPQKCITLKKNSDGFFFPVKDESKCNNCGLCEKFCAIHSNYVKRDDEFVGQQYYAFCIDDENVWHRSSSGGAFSAICNAIIDKYGKDQVLFAGVVIEDLKVKHILSDDYTKFQKSKYVQSDMNDIYHQMDSVLKQNKVVVFSGTPCQCAAVSLYFKNKKNRPILIDFVCHGVGNQDVFEEYLNSLNNKKRKVTNYSFREKLYKCGNLMDFNSKISFDNGKYEYINKDMYVQTFIDQLSTRDSCQTNCQFRHKERLSDFTLGDYRRVASILQKKLRYSSRNYSILTINSNIGLSFVENIRQQGELLECSLENIIETNNLFVKHTYENLRRYDFRKVRKEKGTTMALKKFYRCSIVDKMSNYLHPNIKKIIKKLMRKK